MIENVKCPTCGGPMTSRKNKATGQRFFGCNAYPKCRGTRNTDGEARAERRPFRASETDANESDDEDGSPSERAQRNDRTRWR